MNMWSILSVEFRFDSPKIVCGGGCGVRRQIRQWGLKATKMAMALSYKLCDFDVDRVSLTIQLSALIPAK